MLFAVEKERKRKGKDESVVLVVNSEMEKLVV